MQLRRRSVWLLTGQNFRGGFRGMCWLQRFHQGRSRKGGSELSMVIRLSACFVPGFAFISTICRRGIPGHRHPHALFRCFEAAEIACHLFCAKRNTDPYFPIDHGFCQPMIRRFGGLFGLLNRRTLPTQDGASVEW